MSVTKVTPVMGGGKIVQVVNTQTGATDSGTTLNPKDDTIPQNTEGFEVMTLAVTPTNASNTLLIDVVVFMGTSAAGYQTVALFQDTTANALAAINHIQSVADTSVAVQFRHKMTAGTTSATTFKVRIGQNTAGTVRFNGVDGSRLYGGVGASSITITEIAV